MTHNDIKSVSLFAKSFIVLLIFAQALPVWAAHVDPYIENSKKVFIKDSYFTPLQSQTKKYNYTPPSYTPSLYIPPSYTPPQTPEEIIVPTGKKKKTISVPLDYAWVINPEGTDPMTPIVTGSSVGFTFPTSANPDPNAQRPWVGYFLRPWTNTIKGNYLNASFNVITTGKRITFNHQSEAFNTCGTPANVRLYFQTGGLYNGVDGTRWWSNSVSYTFVKAANGIDVILTTPLEPSEWSNTSGRRGDFNAETLLGFQNAINNPTYVGMTFGGGCFFGHGMNTSRGTASFKLTNYSTSR